MTGPLDRYYNILEGSAKARYLLCKETHVAARLEADDESLWKVHASAPPAAPSTKEAHRGVSLLDVKQELARRMLDRCFLCERRCGAQRSRGGKGNCGCIEPRGG